MNSTDKLDPMPTDPNKRRAVTKLRTTARNIRDRGADIEAARKAGMLWIEIADALEMSRAQVVNLHIRWQREQESGK